MRKLFQLFIRLTYALSRFTKPALKDRIHKVLYYLTTTKFKELRRSYAVLENDKKHYLQADRELFFEHIGCEGRPGMTSEFNETLRLPLPNDLDESCQIWVSTAIREFLPLEYGKGKLLIGSAIENAQGEVLHSGQFELYLDGNNYLFTHLYAAGWISWFVSCEELVRFSPDCTLVLKAKLITPEKSQEQIRKDLGIKTQPVFWGFPQVLRKSNRPKKIINISCESLTDIALVQKMFPKQAHKFSTTTMRLLEKYHAVDKAYTQGDSTMPSCNSQLTGLTPLQHGLGSYNPKTGTQNLPVRNEGILSAAQILKDKKYLTFASAMYTGLGPFYGSYRGFDSYINVDSMGEERWPDLFNGVLPTLETSRDFNSYHYAHFDTLLHVPYVNARSSIFSGIQNLGDLANVDRYVNLYIRSVNRLFEQLHVLDDYVERNSSHSDFFVQITGDHGHGLEPWWGNHKDYALYEQRVRVPYLAKIFGSQSLSQNSRVLNTGVEFFRRSLEFAGAELPENIRRLPQYLPDFKELCIAETILHPNDDDYTLVLSDDTHKFAQSLILNYDTREVVKTKWEKLFAIKNGIPDETQDISSSSPEAFQKLKKQAALHVSQSLKFSQKYPTKSSLNMEEAWSVNDVNAPSAKNRRPKRVVKVQPAPERLFE